MTKFVIRDKNSHLFVQCWSERDTIFLSDNIDNIESYKSELDAMRMAEDLTRHANRYLKDSDFSNLYNVELEAGILHITANFESILR